MGGGGEGKNNVHAAIPSVHGCTAMNFCKIMSRLGKPVRYIFRPYFLKPGAQVP